MPDSDMTLLGEGEEMRLEAGTGAIMKSMPWDYGRRGWDTFS